MSKLEKLCRLAGAGGILAALVMLPVLLVGTPAHATDAFYVNYFANAQIGVADDTVRLIDTNVRPPSTASSPTPPNPLCAMVYVFDEYQELQECCGCPVSAGGRLDLSVDGLTYFPADDWLVSGGSNGSSLLFRGTIKIVSTNSTTISAVNGPCAFQEQVLCDATGARSFYTPAPYLRAWSTHVQNTLTNSWINETRFEKTHEPDADLAILQRECAAKHSVANYIPTSTVPARGNCAAVCTSPGGNPYPAGKYGATQVAFTEDEPGQDANGPLCYTGY